MPHDPTYTVRVQLRRVPIVAACLICLVVAPWAFAMEGDELIGIGAVQKGTAGAGIASPKDATWTFLNPASIVDLERRVDIGVDVILSQRKATPDGPSYVLNLQLPEDDLLLSLVNVDAGPLADSSPAFAPSLGLVWPFERSALGFGIFAVQGNAVNYPRSRTLPGLQADNADRRAQLEIFKMPIAFARRLDNDWAVGAAIVGVYTRLRTDSLTVDLTPTLGDYDWEDSYGIGFKLSLYRRWEKWSFGATYTSRQWTTEFDKYDDLMFYHLDHPQQFQIGVAYRPIRKLEFVLDYKFIDWSDISQVGNDAIHDGLSWNDQHILKFGVTYDITKRFTTRAGFSYGEAPIPRDAVFTNVLFPAIAEEHATIGFSYDLGKRHELHFAYMHAFKNEMTDSGSGDIFSVGGRRTKISLEQDSFTFQYSFKF